MNYTRCFQQGRAWGYVPADRCDQAFVFVTVDDTVPSATLTETQLVSAWNAAAMVNGTRQRALYFFKTIPQAEASAFVRQGMQRARWDCFTYWFGGDSTGGTKFFPTGQKTQVALQQMTLSLRVNGQSVVVSDFANVDFGIANGKLVGKARLGEWTVFDNSSPSLHFARATEFRVELQHPDQEIASGAIEIAVLPDRVTDLPFKVPYSQVKAGDMEGSLAIEEVLSAQVISALHSSEPHSFIALDPRDDSASTFIDKSQRSRLEFADGLPFKSHLQTERGHHVMLQVRHSPARGRGRLRFDIGSGTVDQNGWSLDPGNLGFVPHGDFVFAGVEAVDGVDRSRPVHRILTGATSTEFMELPLDGILRFESDRPAVIKAGDGDVLPPPGAAPAEEGTNPVEDLFHNATGYLTTSWVRPIHPEGNTAHFHTQPERASVFENKPGLADETGPVAPLARKDLPYGRVTKSIPFFPFSGRKARATTQDENGNTAPAKAPDFEYTHLAEARRRLVPRGPSDPAPQDEVTPTLGVTPQGIISAIAGENFTELRFGEPSPFDPRKLDPPPPPLAPDLKPLDWPLEYKIELKAPAPDASKAIKDAYEAFQRAMRANDLFAVFHKMDIAIAAYIKPATDLQIRQFRLLLDVSQQGDSVVIIKYFKNQSLSELLQNEKLWAAKNFLAPNTNWESLEPKVMIGNEPPEALRSIWKDRNWQGILVLDLDPKGMPDLFEALKAGMVVKNLRFHHLGLNFLPVKSTDLAPNKPRLGSAFGLLLYKKKEEPKPPATDEKDPATNNPTDTKYGFLVNSLEMRFAGSQITSFRADVDATFTRLFWDRPAGADNKAKVHLVGGYEARKTPSGETEDVFSLRTADDEKQVISFENSLLDKFTIRRAEFGVTSSGKDTIVTFLGISGDLTFTDKLSAFELFKVKSVSVEKLGLEFDIRRADPTDFKCRFRADSIRADIDFGDVKQSLLSLLPVKFKGFRVAIDKLINLPSLGYLPLGGSFSGVDFHFAFDLELDLGMFGKLSGGRGLKLPLMLGWKAGFEGFDILKHVGLGISFPNWNGKSFEIGIQSFVAIRADSATIKPCKAGDTMQAIAIVLRNARLVFLGYEWPRDGKLDFALFVPAAGGRRMSWALARTATDKDDWLQYIAAGHRIMPPAPGNDSDSPTKSLVNRFKQVLQKVKDDGTPENDACLLLPKQADNNNWFIAGQFRLSELVNIWIAVCDDPTLYGLRLELLSTGFTADAMYRQITERLGVFSAEVGLPDSLRTWQFGAVTIRLPLFGVSVFTDGGFKVDFGYPWNLDFRRSFQFELAIFLGSGGFWFGYTSAAAASLLALENSFNGFQPLTDEHLGQLEKFQAISAAMAMRAGIGRSFELGILKGEASLTVFSTLEGSIAYQRGDSNKTPKLFGIRGTMGIMLHIWVEVNFVVLSAKAEFCAYVLVGIELRKVLALKNDGADRGYYYLTLPVKVFAEVGIYVHVEVWVTIGCVRVKLFDLSFRGTWHFEETIGGSSFEKFADLPAHLTGPGLQEEGGHSLSDRAMAASRLAAPAPPFTWNPLYVLFEPNEALEIFATLLPCPGDPTDFGGAAGRMQPCVVMQLMLKTETGLLKLAQFMAGWALEVSKAGDPTILRETVIRRRRELQSNECWLGDTVAKNVPLATLTSQFVTTFTKLSLEMDKANYAALPGWPGAAWRFTANAAGQIPDGVVQPVAQVRKLKVPGLDQPVDGSVCTFVDYLRSLTDSVLSEFDRTIRKEWEGKSTGLEFASLKWSELWARLAAH